MRYALMRSMDISNGIGIGVSLFVQGCPFHCRGCFNSETWDFDGGKPWTERDEQIFLELAARPFVRHISILGGEPLAVQNRQDVRSLLARLAKSTRHQSIWLYTGYTWEEICQDSSLLTTVIYADVLVDGPYIDAQRDITLPFRGSRNQRVIDVQKSLVSNEIIPYL